MSAWLRSGLVNIENEPLRRACATGQADKGAENIKSKFASCTNERKLCFFYLAFNYWSALRKQKKREMRASAETCFLVAFDDEAFYFFSCALFFLRFCSVSYGDFERRGKGPNTENMARGIARKVKGKLSLSLSSSLYLSLRCDLDGIPCSLPNIPLALLLLHPGTPRFIPLAITQWLSISSLSLGVLPSFFAIHIHPTPVAGTAKKRSDTNCTSGLSSP